MKQPKQIPIAGFILNIKILSEEREGEDILAGLIKKIKSAKIRKPISTDRELAIMTAFTTKVGQQENIVYGKLVSAIDLQNEEWLNLENMESTKYAVPKNLRAKIRQAEYVLIPKAHRLFLISQAKSGISQKQVKKFLEQAIPDVLKEGEDVQIFIEKDKEGIKQITEASFVEWLEITVSKTNNDNSKDAADWVDKEIENMNVNELGIFVNARGEEGINVDNKLLQGALELSSSNGEAKARIIDKGGQSKMVRTSDYEKKFALFADDLDSKVVAIVDFVLGLFRNKD